MPPGTERRVIVDFWVAIDVNASTCLAVVAADGTGYDMSLGPETRFVIDDVMKLSPTHTKVVEAVNGPAGEWNYGTPVGVIVALGVLAPVALRRLSRAKKSS